MTDVHLQPEQTTIRYCEIQDSLWYSLHDVVQFLITKKAVSDNRNLDFFFRQAVAKKLATGVSQMNFNCSLSVKPFDDFYNWVKFSSIYVLCLRSEIPKVRATQILEAIDCNKLPVIEQYHPEIRKILKEVKLNEAIP